MFANLKIGKEEGWGRGKEVSLDMKTSVLFSICSFPFVV